MSTFGNVIRDVPQYQEFRLQRYCYGIPSTLTLSSITWWVTPGESLPVAQAYLWANITTAVSPSGQITSYDATTGEAQFNLILPAASQTSAFTVGAGNAAVIYTASKPGYQYNQVTIQHVASGINTPLSVAVTGTVVVTGANVTGTIVTVNLATDGSGNPTSTSNDIVVAVNQSAVASQLVIASLPVTSTGLGLVINMAAPVSLVGGLLGTSNLTPAFPYPYRIVLNFTDGTVATFEDGTLTVRATGDTTLSTTTISGARAVESGSIRTDKLLNVYVDSTLELFRRLQCWDMRARRSANDPGLLEFPYRNWNPTFVPQVIDDQNRTIPSSRVQVDYDAGTVRILGEQGTEDYYVTFCFDYFGTSVLKAWADLTLQELNIAGANQRYLTTYATIDAAPQSWDAPLWMGVMVKAYRRLAMDASLWTGEHIWVNGDQSRAFAFEMAGAIDTNLAELKQSLKWGRFIAHPTGAYRLFASVGFGFFNYAGSRWRGLELNTIAAM